MSAHLVRMTAGLWSVCLSGCLQAVAPPSAARAPSELGVEYLVEVKDTAAQLFHVTATFSNVRQDRLDLALPIWTPGWYTLEYYAKNVRRFKVTDGTGQRLDAPLTESQRWSVDTRGRRTVVAEFDYSATVLSHNQAKITSRYAFFTGTQLFLEPIGHRSAPSRVRFVAPRGWRVATALNETIDGLAYVAPDYDVLVDAPTWLGAFQSHRFEVEGKPHYLVFDSARRFPADSIKRYTDRMATMIRTASAMFGGLPYDKYLFMTLPDSAEGASGALEHGNSQVGCCGGPRGLGIPGRYAAHEFFHLWNVKRIRPAELWPYDYSRPVSTPSLWVSEGITDYYGLMLAYRAGLTPEAVQTIVAWAGSASEIESNRERRFVSLSDASSATWRAYLREPVSYYFGGAVLGLLIDLSILHDTDGQRGLDDVMRTLDREYYARGRGFTPDDLIREVSRTAGRDYSEFFRRYVSGVDIPPYDSILAYAGIQRLGPTTGFFGGFGTAVEKGRRFDSLTTGGPADAAGMRKGDVLSAVDGVAVDRLPLTPNGCCLVIAPEGARIIVTVLRDGESLEMPVTLRSGQAYMTVFDPAATIRQLQVRRAWLAKPPDSR